MSEYQQVRPGKLILKGEPKKRKKSKQKDITNKVEKIRKTIVDDDALKHGGWWQVNNVSDITGAVAIQFTNQSYIKALDNGLFTLGVAHDDGEGPAPEEILAAFQINEEKLAFKSGYGKYLKVEMDGAVTGRSDAVGSMEQWKPVFQDGKVALLGGTGRFISIDPEDDACVALRKEIGQAELFVIRACSQREVNKREDEFSEEKDDLKQIEVNYVKKFQKFQDKKSRINTSAVKELEIAKVQGNLHEKLLDRRSKMKADRYCK